LIFAGSFLDFAGSFLGFAGSFLGFAGSFLGFAGSFFFTCILFTCFSLSNVFCCHIYFLSY
jgi:hypothetical protein